MTTYRVRATTHRAQVRVIGPTCDLSGPRALSGAHAPSIPLCESPTMKQPPSMLFFPHQQAETSPQNQHDLWVIGHFVLLGLVPGVVVGGGVVEFVEADCVAPAGDGAGGLVGLTGVLPGIFEGCVGGHGRQDCCCWLRVG